MRKQKNTSYGTVISFRLPNKMALALGKEARALKKPKVKTAGQFARLLTVAKLTGDRMTLMKMLAV